VITLGGDRRHQIEEMFEDLVMAEHFEKPMFSEGVTSRYIRNRFNFFKTAHDAGLLPEKEWEAILEATEEKTYEGQPTERFFDCLEGIEVTKGRHGCQEDVELHYTVELWRKAKAINRARSVLACVFAHLIAMKKFAEDGNFDLILEDNVRTDPKRCARKVWEFMKATEEWEDETSTTTASKCHFRFVGWLGSVANIKWIMETHIPKRKYMRKDTSNDGDGDDDTATTIPMPLLEHLNEDPPTEVEYESNTDTAANSSIEKDQVNPTGKNDGEEPEIGAAEQAQKHTKPGGNLLWGAYAYWISNEGYESLLETLRSDVGAILWKGKRMRNYAVKPIDKILPRQTLSKFGPTAVQISSQPAFFRAPMLTSKIHAQWDPGFCESTEYQLRKGKLGWSDLWLTDTERDIVNHHNMTGEWLTIKELELLQK